MLDTSHYQYEEYQQGVQDAVKKVLGCLEQMGFRASGDPSGNSMYVELERGGQRALVHVEFSNIYIGKSHLKVSTCFHKFKVTDTPCQTFRQRVELECAGNLGGGIPVLKKDINHQKLAEKIERAFKNRVESINRAKQSRESLRSAIELAEAVNREVGKCICGVNRSGERYYPTIDVQVGKIPTEKIHGFFVELSKLIEQHGIGDAVSPTDSNMQTNRIILGED